MSRRCRHTLVTAKRLYISDLKKLCLQFTIFLFLVSFDFLFLSLLLLEPKLTKA
jgi:hypothetical protein